VQRNEEIAEGRIKEKKKPAEEKKIENNLKENIRMTLKKAK
jgi:hypothetical protein